MGEGRVYTAYEAASTLHARAPKLRQGRSGGRVGAIVTGSEGSGSGRGAGVTSAGGTGIGTSVAAGAGDGVVAKESGAGAGATGSRVGPGCGGRCLARERGPYAATIASLNCSEISSGTHAIQKATAVSALAAWPMGTGVGSGLALSRGTGVGRAVSVTSPTTRPSTPGAAGSPGPDRAARWPTLLAFGEADGSRDLGCHRQPSSQLLLARRPDVDYEACSSHVHHDEPAGKREGDER